MKAMTIKILAAAVLPGAASVAAADPPESSIWDGCSFENFAFDSTNLEWLEPPLEGYDLCVTFGVKVTLHGHMTSCLLMQDFKPSHDVFGD